MSSIPAAQASYQVRFDWGMPGLAAIGADVDGVIWVDEIDDAEAIPADAQHGTLARADELAAWALARQEALGGRFRIAVVAAGATRADGSFRVCVEDLLAAGAIIDAIAARGIDHQSPEAAAAASAYAGLKNATRHLVSASVSSREQRESAAS